MWVGTTYYFTWLDGRFSELEEQSKDAKPDEKHFVWMVHSGGFYAVEKQKIPKLMPATLHWFKWEAGITWITGFLLFGLLFYHGGYLINFEDPPIPKGAAIGLSFGLLLAGWVAYDLLWKFCRNEMVGIVISYALIVATAWLSCKYFSGRAAYHATGRDVRHDHGRQCLDAHPARTTAHGRGAQGRSATQLGGRRARQSPLETQHFHRLSRLCSP